MMMHQPTFLDLLLEAHIGLEALFLSALPLFVC